MKEKRPYDYKILIPFGAFLTANSILIAADFVFTQLWFNFQPMTDETQWEAIGVGAIFVYYFVIVSIVSMILAILGREKCCKDELQGLPVILFFFSLGFTMCFVFQAMVTLTIKIINQNLSIGSTFYQHSSLPWFYGGFGLALLVTITAVFWPTWWDNLFGSFKNHPKSLMLAILGILIMIIGGVFIIDGQSICHYIRWSLSGVGLLALIGTCCYCWKKRQGEAK